MKSATEIKQTAQNKLIQAMSDEILRAEENGEDAAVVGSMKCQAIRVAKLFGFISFPGIF
jgi:hypothetical protein